MKKAEETSDELRPAYKRSDFGEMVPGKYDDMNDTSVIRVAGVCTLLGVAAGLLGSAIGAVHGLGGQEIPLDSSTDFIMLAHNQIPYLVREWFFLAYAIFVVAEGVGLYYLTRRAGSLALWALVAWSTGICIGIVQDAAVVAFVKQFPAAYAAADATARLALQPLARTLMAIIGVQQSVANALLSLGVAIYSIAILRTRVASKWFALLGFASAASGLLYGIVIGFAPAFSGLKAFAEQAFGLAVLWDALAGIVMFRYSRRE